MKKKRSQYRWEIQWNQIVRIERWLENKEMVGDRVVVGKYRYGHSCKSTSLYKVGNSWLEIGNEKNGYSTKRWLE